MPTIEVRRPLPLLDLAYVLLNLWPRGRDELAGLGLTLEQGFITAAGFIAKGPSASLAIDGKPVCYAGAVIDKPSYTWFQATDAFERYASTVTRWLRREIAQVPGDLVIYSQCIHSETPKWFRVIGFDLEPWYGTSAAGKPLYRFRRR